MAAKRRADQLLVEQGLAESRAKAQALILAGLVSIAGRRVDKPGTPLAEGAELTLAGRDHPWVSRGGVKLAFALDHFAIDPAGMIALDIGASTGGFTDVLLANGAARVHAVGVGRGQLAWKLRQDPRGGGAWGGHAPSFYAAANAEADGLRPPRGSVFCLATPV